MSHRKSTSIFRFQSLSQILQKIRAIFGALLTLLLGLNDSLTDIPIHLHSTEVHTPNRILPCRSDNLPHFIIEVLYILYLVHSTNDTDFLLRFSISKNYFYRLSYNQKTKQFNSKSDPYNVLSLCKRGIKNSFFCFFVCSLIKVGEVNMNLNSTPRRSYYKKNTATRTGDSVKFCIIYMIGKFYSSTLPHSISTLLLPNYYCSSSSKSILTCWD